MTKHTPGPWVACGYGDYSDYEGKCRVVLGEGGDIRTAVVLGFDTPENEANARLIAAAPDLLAALTSLYEAYCSAMSSEFDFPGRPWTPERDDDADALSARAAIQKATKEQG